MDRQTDGQSDILSSCWRQKRIPFKCLLSRLQARYNFKLQRGEVKIDREYRQTCPAHGGPPVHPIVGETGGARWVMQGLMRFIRARFYSDGESKSRTKGKKSSSISSSNTSSGTSLDRIESGPDPEMIQERRRRRRNPLSLYKPQPDHNPHNCEACLLRRCPRPWRLLKNERY